MKLNKSFCVTERGTGPNGGEKVPNVSRGSVIPIKNNCNFVPECEL